MINSTPKIRRGMPIMAPTIVADRITPTIIKTRPRITATSLPVSLVIAANSLQRATNGQSIHGVFLSLLVIFPLP